MNNEITLIETIKNIRIVQEFLLEALKSELKGKYFISKWRFFKVENVKPLSSLDYVNLELKNYSGVFYTSNEGTYYHKMLPYHFSLSLITDRHVIKLNNSQVIHLLRHVIKLSKKCKNKTEYYANFNNYIGEYFDALYRNQ